MRGVSILQAVSRMNTSQDLLGQVCDLTIDFHKHNYMCSSRPSPNTIARQGLRDDNIYNRLANIELCSSFNFARHGFNRHPLSEGSDSKGRQERNNV